MPPLFDQKTPVWLKFGMGSASYTHALNWCQSYKPVMCPSTPHQISRAEVRLHHVIGGARYIKFDRFWNICMGLSYTHPFTDQG